MKKVWTYIIAVLCIIAGIVLLIKPEESTANIIYYLGIVLLVIGIVKILGSIINKNSVLSPGSYLFGGILNTLFGLFLMVSQEKTLAFVRIPIGLWLILVSSSNLALILNYKRSNNNINIKLLIANILKLIIGIVILTVPRIVVFFTGWVLGVILVFIGVYVIIVNISKEKKSIYKVKVK